MKNLDRISSAFCFFLGLAVLIRGFQLKLKVSKEMGPGLLPVVVGGILAFLSMVLFFRSVVQGDSSEREGSFWANPYGWKLVFLTLLASGAYPFSLHYLGFLLSNFLLLFFLFLVIARLQWWIAGAGGLATALAAHLIFVVWLKVTIPQALMGF